MKSSIFIFSFLILITGCTSFRGIPSHGGGKRFDEEQRIVAGAIRQSIDEMKLNELAGKKVRIVYDFLTTYGNGNVTWGGLQDISLSGNDYHTNTAYDYGPVPLRDYSYGGGSNNFSTSLRYRPNISFYTSNVNTDKDVKYLISTLEMKCRHEKVNIVPNKEEVTLYVLVDVLGLNRSRKDYLIYKEDYYKASCELTYYAVGSDGKMLFKARQAGGQALYEEDFLLFFGFNRVTRDIYPLMASPYPTNGIEHDDSKSENGFYYSGKGWVEEFENGKSNGLEQLQHQTVKLLSNRARSLLDSGQTEEAVEVLKQLRNLDPDHEELKKIQQAYESQLNFENGIKPK